MTALSDLVPLLDRLRHEVRQEADSGADRGAVAADLDRLAARLREPLIVAIAGKVKAGKSTLLNALVGEELAPTDAGECTQVVTWYRNGPTYRVTITLDDGSTRQVPFHRDGGALELDMGGTPIERVAKIVVDWPSSRLADVTLIDTPGLDSVNAHVSARAAAFLGTADDGDERGEADAVVYLMRHVHRTDLAFLEAFRDDAHAGPSPISSIAVLSRADEVGACRLDAMSAAQRVADNWRRDPRLRRLCQTVVPIAGLAAQAGASLREAEYRALAALAALSRSDADQLLLTADRFVADVDCGVTQIEREQLLERLGVFGVRLSMSLIRLGSAPSATALAGELTRRSGVLSLRTMLSSVFAERRDILKARVAIAGIDAALAQLPRDGFEPARAELERIEASANEFAEIHLLNAIRAGDLTLRSDEASELERLFGSIGAPSRVRLGLAQAGSETAADADADAVRAAVLDGVERWRRRAENPLTSLDLATAARAVARTYESMLPG